MKIRHHSRKSKYSLRSTRQHTVQAGSKPLDTSSLLSEVTLKVVTGDTPEAVRLLYDQVKQIEAEYPQQEDEKRIYLCLDDPEQQKQYREPCKPTKEVCFLNGQYDVVYWSLGSLLLSAALYDEAEEMFETAIAWNPLSIRSRLDLGKVYVQREQWKALYALSLFCLEHHPQEEELAQCYRNLGDCYSEWGEYELATALYWFSTLYDSNSTDAVVGLYHIALRSEKISPPPGLEQIIDSLEKNHIPLVRLEEVSNMEEKLNFS